MAPPRNPSSKPPSLSEGGGGPGSGIKVTLLVIPLVVIALVAWDGRHFDPGLVDFKRPGEGGNHLAGLFPKRVGELQPLGTIRTFGKENLYEYVNGHAEFFLGAGFDSLAVGEFARPGTDRQAPAVTIDLYDMGTPLNAFGVLMDEAGETSTPVEIGAMGFAGGKGVSAIHGRYYLKVASFTGAEVATEAAKTMVTAIGPQPQDDSWQRGFPDFGTPLGVKFVKENYRGMPFFDNVIEKSFKREEESFQVFLIAATPEKVAIITRELQNFLTVEEIETSREQEGERFFVRVHDRYEGEWFFLTNRDHFLGVFSPLDDFFKQKLSHY
ncbi:MAG: hypothetical protein HQL59_03935 [Magnetococcales bacterium]|nr:hypothetical protein [Magnetococcales bacterium]